MADVGELKKESKRKCEPTVSFSILHLSKTAYNFICISAMYQPFVGSIKSA